MVTIRDVAKVAGVSRTTVSRVVRGDGKVGAACRARVQKIINDMGYRPNLNARALANRQSDIIGVVVPNIADSFIGRLVRGIENAARDTDYKVMFSSTDNDPLLEQKAIESMKEIGCHTIIFHSVRASESFIQGLVKDFPNLVVVGQLISNLAANCVWTDNFFGGRITAEYLLAKGHTKIAIVTSEYVKVDAGERVAGICSVMEKHGHPVPAKNIEYVDIGSEIGGGAGGVVNLLAKKCDFTAIVTFNDTMAFETINALRDKGLNVPADISVMGFDNLPFCEMFYPKVTTVDYPIFKMGEYAANLSMQRNSGKENTQSSHMFLPKVVERESVLDLNL